MLKFAFAGAFALLSTAVAHAATYNLSYELTGGAVLTAIIDGTLQGDGDTVVVNAVSSSAFNGTTGPALPVLGDGTGTAPPTGTPLLSLSGATLAFVACDSPICNDGFLLIYDGTSPLYSSGPSYGEALDLVDLSRYSLTAAAVPLPAGAWLLLGGLGAFAAFRRRAG